VRRYIEETGLPFDILVDERRDALRAYGVWHRVGIDAWNISRPAVFLIDADATIAYASISNNQREYPEVSEMLAAADAPRNPRNPRN
jgi:peroxiredoxin